MLDPEIRDMAQAKNFGALTVIPAGGHPMTHVMWVDADDDCLLINTEIGRAKATAMDNDPRVTVALWDAADPYHYAEVRGRVVEAIAGQPAADHINKLAAKYIGGPYTFGPTDQRIIYRVEPLRQRARSTGEAPRPTQPTPNGVAPGHGTVVPLDPAIRDMAQAKNFGVLTVIPAGGHPMTHVMWVDADDDCLLINTQLGRAKAVAMDNDPRVTVTIWDHDNPYHYAEVRGLIVGVETGEAAAAHIHKLAGKYVGGPYTMGPTDIRVLYRVAPLRQRTM